MNNMTNEEALVAYLRSYAYKHYGQGWGWDTIVECWSDGDILEALRENQFDLPKTVESIQSYLNVIVDRADTNNEF